MFELISLLNNGTQNYGISKEVDILMGFNKIPTSLKERVLKIKRMLKQNGR